MLTQKPLVSIITVSFNSEKTIRDTIESVLNQTYENIEYIIVDGLSIDKTVSIAKNYEISFKEKGRRYKIISEKDDGLYDAMNKGIKYANGEIIGILNSDDFYVDEFVVEKVVKKMVSEKAECLYADLLYVDEENTEKVIRKWKAKKGDFRFGWNPPHPTSFITKRTYEKFGLYNLKYTIASDYDMLFKIIHLGKVKVIYLEEYIVKMRYGGKSTSGIRSNLVGNKEIYNILKDSNQKLKSLTIFLRLFRKLNQFI